MSSFRHIRGRYTVRRTPITPYSLILTGLGSLTMGAAVGGATLLLATVFPGGRSRLQARFDGVESGVVGLACLISFIAVAGSLYLSEVAGFIPCRLCWYQRIAMYPLLPVLAVATWRRDAGVWRYGLPLSVLGLGISAYHVVIQNVPAMEPPVCAGEVPCSAVYVRVFDP